MLGVGDVVATCYRDTSVARSLKLLALPFFNQLTVNQIAEVCDNLLDILANVTP